MNFVLLGSLLLHSVSKFYLVKCCFIFFDQVIVIISIIDVCRPGEGQMNKGTNLSQIQEITRVCIPPLQLRMTVLFLPNQNKSFADMQ